MEKRTDIFQDSSQLEKENWQKERIRRKALHSLQVACESLEEHPPAGDRFISSYSYAIRHLLEDESIANEWIDRLYLSGSENEHFHAPGPTEALNRIIKSFQSVFMTREVLNQAHGLPQEILNVDYPQDFEDKANCLSILRTLLSGEHGSYIRAKIFVDLKREMMSNVEERYKSAAAILGGFWEDQQPRRVLDVGCSGGFGSAMLLKPEEVSWNRFNIVDDLNQPKPNVLKRPSQLLDCLMENYKKPTVRGVDLWSIKEDEGVKGWVESCSFYPAERLDMSRRRRFDRLKLHLDDPGLSFTTDDIRESSTVELLIADGQKYDLVFASTVFYQFNEEDKHQVFNNLMRCVTPNGLIVIQDFFDRSGNKMSLIPRDNWYEGTYNTFAIEAGSMENGWLEIFKWKNGRCRIAELGADAARIIKPLNEYGY